MESFTSVYDGIQKFLNDHRELCKLGHVVSSLKYEKEYLEGLGEQISDSEDESESDQDEKKEQDNNKRKKTELYHFKRALKDFYQHSSFCFGGSFDVNKNYEQEKIDPETNFDYPDQIDVFETNEDKKEKTIDENPIERKDEKQEIVNETVNDEKDSSEIKETDDSSSENEKEQIDINKNWVSAGLFYNLDSKILIQHSKVASFGDLKSQKTVYNPSVRTAYEILPENYRFSGNLYMYRKPKYGWKTVFDEEPEFIKQIHNDLLNHFGFKNNIYLQKYKMNIYTTGGFFKPHVDTQISENMIGTVVVCLPSTFEGGELIVSHHGKKQTFDFKDKSKIQWAAFYSDCIHEVKPVTSGYRITLTYCIMTSEEKRGTRWIRDKKIYNVNLIKGPMLDSDKKSCLYELKKAVSKDREKEFGIILSHKYTHSSLKKEFLKDLDSELYNLLVPLGKVKLVPVLHRLVVKDGRSYDYDEFKLKHNVYRFTLHDLNYLIEKEDKLIRLKDQDIPFLCAGNGFPISEKSIPGAEHTGNEARPDKEDNIYFAAAIIFERTINK